MSLLFGCTLADVVDNVVVALEVPLPSNDDDEEK